MLPNPLPQKLIQISEEALPPIHVPLISGNDLIIFSQQDVRKIQDSRVFFMSQVLPNGALKIINYLDATGCLQQFSQLGDAQCQQVFNSLLEFLNRKTTASQIWQQAMPPQTQQHHTESTYPQPMEVSMPADNVATISQQLQWNKCQNTSGPFPLHYSHGTSTTEIDCKQEVKDRTAVTCNSCKMCRCCENRIRCFDKSTSIRGIQNVCSKASNEALDAREQLKKKKINQSLI